MILHRRKEMSYFIIVNGYFALHTHKSNQTKNTTTKQTKAGKKFSVKLIDFCASQNSLLIVFCEKKNQKL